jgi:hypothetical protein
MNSCQAAIGKIKKPYKGEKMLRKCLLAAFVFVFISSCNAAGTPPPLPIITITPTSEPLPTTASIVAVEAAESGITITGTVMDVSLSARLITLKDPVEGFHVLALTENCELTSSNRDEIELYDIQPGMTVRASGQPGESDSLLTSFVLVQ